MHIRGYLTFCLCFAFVFRAVTSFYIFKKPDDSSSLSASDVRSLVEKAAISRVNTGHLLQRFLRQVNSSTNTSQGQGQVKTPYCPTNYSSIPNNRPLLCYQCQGEARQRDNICDNTLWHFARKTEQYNQRIRCPNDRGFFCSKVIQEKSGIRLTQRGCLGRGPIRILSGKIIPLNEGCVIYEQNGFITTTCLCRKDLCNSAHLLFKSTPFILAAILLCHFLYALM